MNIKILIVDDSNFARRVMREALESRSYSNLYEAGTAKDAFDLFVQEAPDLTLLDISLPDCQDLTLLQTMLDKKPDAKIVMCSALRQQIIIDDALKYGAKGYIQKPFDRKALLETVDQVLADV